MIPELLRNDTSMTNVLKFSLHAVTLLSQLDPKDFSHLLLNTSIEESYRGFFKLFGGHHVNLLFSGFQDYFQTLTKEEQVPMFNFMGSVLNTPLYYSAENSSCDASTVDLRQLLEVIPKNYYSRIDPRLTSFVDSAVGQNQKMISKDENEVKFSYKMNAVENILKARHLKFVSPIGLMQGILIYIYSNRSANIATMFLHFAGAKGSLSTVKSVINRSEKTSQQCVPDKVIVNFTFDNVQCLMKHWRVFAQKKPQALAAIATSVVQTFPDGLKTSSLQYQAKNSPMNWLYKFSLSEENRYLVSNYDQNSLKALMGARSEALELVLGYWDQTIKDQISIVSKELGEDFRDNVSLAVETIETENHSSSSIVSTLYRLQPY